MHRHPDSPTATPTDEHTENLDRAARYLLDAGSVLLTAGAGMGVDSGLPDFRGDEGFWRAYPPYERLGVGFEAMADPRHFHDDPAFAWGFYGHRRNLYRETLPHEGYQVMRRIVAGRPHHVFTSNVDNQFRRAGFDPQRIYECHGSIEHNQCTDSCAMHVYSVEDESITVDETTMRATSPLPTCPHCGALARPNILMFGDAGFDPERTLEQRTRLEDWLTAQDLSRLVVLECGAGTHIPTVRHQGDLLSAHGARLIRINPREPEVLFDGQIGVALGALDALTRIEVSMGTPRNISPTGGVD